MNNNQVKSCCTIIDKSFYILLISTIIVLSSLALTMYKLISAHTCELATPWYILLSNISSVAIGFLFHYLKHKNNLFDNEASV